MIKPKQIPDEVLEAAQKAWEQDAESFRPNAKSIAAAINAWPGVCKSESVCGWSKWIELPIEEEQ